jgi:biopolymer transport protein ExbB
MDRIFEIWASGGWVMVPLFGLAVLLYTQAFQLVLYMRRVRFGGEQEARWWEWVRTPEDAEGKVREIVEYTQSNVSSQKEIHNRFDDVRADLLGPVDRRTRFVSTLVAAAPLLGLLGTVLGMLQTFFGLSTGGGSETAGVVASGISEALVTTQAGITIALPALFLVLLIQRQGHELEGKIARLESLTITHFQFD